MDDDSLNIRNWGYYEPSIKGNLGLQLMSSAAADPHTRSFLSGHDQPAMFNPTNGAFSHLRDSVVSEPPLHLDYVRDSWVNNREKYLNILSGPPSYIFTEPPTNHQMQILQPTQGTVKEERISIEIPTLKKESDAISKRRTGDDDTPKAPKPKKSKKSTSKGNGGPSGQRVRPVKNMDMVINGIDMDISTIPIPVCSCTGTPQQCYRWGCGGWQSACCTTTISMYPLPMSTKRRGARIAGRKMSQGAFKKVLEKLGAEGYNFSDAIDLRTFWAKHGTNKFVTIR